MQLFLQIFIIVSSFVFAEFHFRFFFDNITEKARKNLVLIIFSRNYELILKEKQLDEKSLLLTNLSLFLIYRFV